MPKGVSSLASSDAGGHVVFSDTGGVFGHVVFSNTGGVFGHVVFSNTGPVLGQVASSDAWRCLRTRGVFGHGVSSDTFRHALCLRTRCVFGHAVSSDTALVSSFLTHLSELQLAGQERSGELAKPFHGERKILSRCGNAWKSI